MGAIGGLGASSGALLGGVLTQTLGWPAIFAINVPLGALVIVLGLRVIPADARADGPRHFDVAGAVLVTAGLVGLTYGIVRTDTLGWGSTGVLVPLAGRPWRCSRRSSSSRRASRSAAGAAVDLQAAASSAPPTSSSCCMYSALFSMFFFVTLYLQQVLGDDALAGRPRRSCR